MKSLITALAALLMPACALAQTLPVTSSNLSSTIASTNTFQSIQGQNNGRNGCTIQDNGTHTMYVFFGPIANATTSNSVTLNTGQSLTCEGTSRTVLRDQVSITGTAGDSYYANFQ